MRIFARYRISALLAAVLVFALCPLTLRAHPKPQPQDLAETPPQPQSAEFQQYVRAANADRDAGDAEAAQRNYSAALKLDPTWQEGWWSLGSLEYSRDHFADAIPAFRTLAQLAPQASLAWTFLGLCEFETRDYASALADLQKGQSLGSAAGDDDPEIARVAKYHLALLLIRNHQFAKATALLTALMIPAQASPQITFAMGLARLEIPSLPDEVESSRTAQIQEAGEAALREQPLAATTAAPRGELWNAAMQSYSAGKYSDAIARLKEWLQQNPQSGTGWAVLGLSEYALGDFEQALRHLQQGQQLGLRGSVESLQLADYHLGILLNRTGQFAAAEQVLLAAPPAGALSEKIQFALGMAVLRLPQFPEELAAAQEPLVRASGEVAALLRDSKYDDAFPKLQALLAKFPATPFLHYTYGTALAALSLYDEAAAQFRAELPLSPQSELPYLGLASLELQRHRPADALPAAQRAAELAPRNATAHYYVGRSLLETGKPAEAIAGLQRANSLTPGSPEVHFALAKAYAKSGQPEKAAAERNLFAQLNAEAELQRSHTGNQAYGAHDAPGAALFGVQQPAVAGSIPHK